jgi:serine/threonine protein kinase
MQLKIGDFGLAIPLHGGADFDIRDSVCGTPNYMAPEILIGKDTDGLCEYSFQADIWAIGIILYTLLVGRPPFEGGEVKETYQRIKDIKYIIPSHHQHPRLKG